MQKRYISVFASRFFMFFKSILVCVIDEYIVMEIQEDQMNDTDYY